MFFRPPRHDPTTRPGRRAVSSRRPAAPAGRPELLEARTLFAAAYTVVDLGTLGGAVSHALDVNNNNQVVGDAEDAAGDTVAFGFTDANRNNRADAGEMASLGTVVGDSASSATAINDAGVAVGASYDDAGRALAVRFDGFGAVADLGLGDRSTATDVNAAGTVVGGMEQAGAYLPFVRAADGSATVLTPTAAGFDQSGEAEAINDAGVVVGFTSGAAGDAAFVRTAAGDMTTVALPSAAEPYSYAWDVNAAGRVAGDGYNAADAYRAFRTAAANGTPADLGVVSGFAGSSGLGINAGGDVVGALDPLPTAPDGTPTHAFLYSGGVMRDLNAQVPTGTGWVLQEARAINDNGYIVGSGTNPSGQTHAFLLVPAGPAVTAFQVNDGSAQRSMVRGLTVSFDAPVLLDPGAVAVVGRDGAGAGTTVSLANPSGDGRTWVVSFAGPAVVGGSLPDGVYDLTVAGAKVRLAADPAAAVGAAADYTLAFHRLYSDVNGDGVSDNADLFQMRSTYLKPSTDPAYKDVFDYNADGVVDNADVFQVRSRRSKVFQGY